MVDHLDHLARIIGIRLLLVDGCGHTYEFVGGGSLLTDWLTMVAQYTLLVVALSLAMRHSFIISGCRRRRRLIATCVGLV